MGIFRVWSTSLSDPGSFPIHPPGETSELTNSDLPLTADARAAVAEFDPEIDAPTLDCAAQGMPRIMWFPYPMEFVDQGDRILLRLESYDAVRTIHMTPQTGSDSAGSAFEDDDSIRPKGPNVRLAIGLAAALGSPRACRLRQNNAAQEVGLSG